MTSRRKNHRGQLTDSKPGLGGPCRSEPGQIRFGALWVVIILISAIDGFLVLRHRGHLDELNPQGQLLIALNGGQVWLLLAAKLLGTMLCAVVLLLIRQYQPRVGIIAAAAVAGLQVLLLVFLWWG
jgi:hypothetical protein